MKLLILADIHGRTGAISLLSAQAAACEAIIIAGDITNFGDSEELAAVIDPLEVFGKPIIAVPGNCDGAGVDRELQRRRYSVHANVIIHNDIAFLGVGGSLPCPGHTPNEADESVFTNILEEAVKLTQQKFLILVTHQPAWGNKLDKKMGGGHTGSRALRDFIEQYKPLLAISGHMHEAAGTDQIGPTTLINPGPLRNGRYALADLTEDQVKVELLRI